MKHDATRIFVFLFFFAALIYPARHESISTTMFLGVTVFGIVVALVGLALLRRMRWIGERGGAAPLQTPSRSLLLFVLFFAFAAFPEQASGPVVGLHFMYYLAVYAAFLGVGRVLRQNGTT